MNNNNRPALNAPYQSNYSPLQLNEFGSGLGGGQNLLSHGGNDALG